MCYGQDQWGNEAFSPFLPSLSQTFFLPIEMIILLTRSLLRLVFAVLLAERFLQFSRASCLSRYVP